MRLGAAADLGAQRFLRVALQLLGAVPAWRGVAEID